MPGLRTGKRGISINIVVPRFAIWRSIHVYPYVEPSQPSAPQSPKSYLQRHSECKTANTKHLSQHQKIALSGASIAECTFSDEEVRKIRTATLQE